MSLPLPIRRDLLQLRLHAPEKKIVLTTLPSAFFSLPTCKCRQFHLDELPLQKTSKVRLRGSDVERIFPCGVRF